MRKITSSSVCDTRPSRGFETDDVARALERGGGLEVRRAFGGTDLRARFAAGASTGNGEASMRGMVFRGGGCGLRAIGGVDLRGGTGKRVGCAATCGVSSLLSGGSSGTLRWS